MLSSNAGRVSYCTVAVTVAVALALHWRLALPVAHSGWRSRSLRHRQSQCSPSDSDSDAVTSLRVPPPLAVPVALATEAQSLTASSGGTNSSSVKLPQCTSSTSVPVVTRSYLKNRLCVCGTYTSSQQWQHLVTALADLPLAVGTAERDKINRTFTPSHPSSLAGLAASSVGP
jgi:hypothetical protein